MYIRDWHLNETGILGYHGFPTFHFSPKSRFFLGSQKNRESCPTCQHIPVGVKACVSRSTYTLFVE